MKISVGLVTVLWMCFVVGNSAFSRSLGKICLSNTNGVCMTDAEDIPVYPTHGYSNWLMIQTNWIPWECLWEEQQFVLEIETPQTVTNPECAAAESLSVQEEMIITRITRKVLDLENDRIKIIGEDVIIEDTEQIAPHQFYFEMVPVIDLADLYIEKNSNFSQILPHSESDYPPSLREYVRLNNLLLTNRNNSFFPLEETGRLSEELNDYYRIDLYRRFHMSKQLVWKEAAMNVVPSLGSWMVGNRNMALYTDIGIGLGGSLWLIGNITASDQLQSDGLTILIAAYVVNFALPFINERLYNTKLRDILEIDQETHDLVMEISESQPAVDFSWRF